MLTFSIFRLFFFWLIANPLVVKDTSTQAIEYDYGYDGEDDDDDFGFLSSYEDLEPEHVGINPNYEDVNWHSDDDYQSFSQLTQNIGSLRGLQPGFLTNPIQTYEPITYSLPPYGPGYRHTPASTGRRQPYRNSRRYRGYGYPLIGAREYDGYQQSYDHGYQQQQVKVQQVPVYKQVYVPVPVIPKERKKKIISIDKGFHIIGGTQVFGKFKKLKQCMKLCAAIPTCFAADYNPWLYKCYIHTNITACSTLSAHKKFIHFKKVPCDVPEAPQGLVSLGAQLFNGLEQKGIKSLQDCLKKCASAGQGIAPTISELLAGFPQLCFGIDYDFARHKCYFHTNSTLCPTAANVAVAVPTSLVAAPGVVNIVLCGAIG